MYEPQRGQHGQVLEHRALVNRRPPMHERKRAEGGETSLAIKQLGREYSLGRGPASHVRWSKWNPIKMTPR
jgi:hypothetical protein